MPWFTSVNTFWQLCGKEWIKRGESEAGRLAGSCFSGAGERWTWLRQDNGYRDGAKF